MSSILSKSPIYVHATIHLRNNGAHHSHYTNIQSEGVEYSRRLPKNLWQGVEGLSPSWADVTSSSKKLSSNSSKSSSSFACCASIAHSNFLRQRSMVGEAPAHGKNDGVFKVQLYKRLGCLASKRPAAFWPPPNGPLVCVYKVKMVGNQDALNTRPITMESGYSLILHFSTLYLDKIQMKECINHKSNEFCWNLNIFEQFIKKIISNTKYAQNHQGFFTICMNHNKEQDGGWKSSVSLKFEIFTTSFFKYNKSFNFKNFFNIKHMKIRYCKLYDIS
jgi:hypothetical protein